jgi:DNA-binding Lrp family transcriptional regulator
VAIKDNRLKEFFSKQKVGAFDTLLTKGKVIDKETKAQNDTSTAISPINESAYVAIDAPSPRDDVINSYDIKHSVKAEELPKTVSKPLANREQLVSKPLANPQQIVSDTLANRNQIVSKPLAEALAQPLANISEIEISDLMVFSKKEREFLTLIFQQCRHNGDLVSPAISTEAIRQLLNISAERVRNLIYRIVKKGGIKIITHKSGQSAYRVFELNKSIYQLMVEPHSTSINSFHSLAQPLADPLANRIYSSSNKKNTTTSLPEEWKNINFAPLEHIGFAEQHLMDIYSTNANHPTIVQDSIFQFAFGLEQGKCKYDSPLKVLIGTLRKGKAWIESGYESPKDRALKELYVRQKAENEKRDTMIKQMVEIQFPEWRKKLSQDEIEQIVPAETLGLKLAPAITSALRVYFVDNVLMPQLRSKNLIL